MKLAGWLLRLMLTVVMISGLTIYTTYYIVDGYIQQLLRQLQIQAEGPGLNPAGWITGWLGLDRGQKVKNGEGRKENGGQADDGSGDDSKGESGYAVSDHGGAVQPDEEAVPEEDDALPVMGQPTDEPSEAQDPVVMSPEELTEKKNQISTEDKTLLMDLLLSKLPEDELLQISTYVEDGLTGSELRDIQQLIAKHLNEDEYGQVMAIIEKYTE